MSKGNHRRTGNKWRCQSTSDMTRRWCSTGRTSAQGHLPLGSSRVLNTSKGGRASPPEIQPVHSFSKHIQITLTGLSAKVQSTASSSPKCCLFAKLRLFHWKYSPTKHRNAERVQNFTEKNTTWSHSVLSLRSTAVHGWQCVKGSFRIPLAGRPHSHLG